VAAGLVLTANSGGCPDFAACRLRDVHRPMMLAESAPSDLSWPLMAAIDLFDSFATVHIRSARVGLGICRHSIRF